MKKDLLQTKYLLVALIVLVVLGFTAVLLQNNSKQPSRTPLTTITTEITPSPDPTEDWEELDVLQLNLSFKIPRKIYDRGNFVVNEYPGPAEIGGKTLCGTLEKKVSGLLRIAYAGATRCNVLDFGITATTKEPDAYYPGYGFLYSQGYVVKNGEYYLNHIAGQLKIDRGFLDVIDREFINSNGIKILVVRGNSSMRHNPGGSLEKSNQPILGSPGEGYYGALVNTSGNNIYPGFAVQLKKDTGVTEAEFNQILDTFRFTN